MYRNRVGEMLKRAREEAGYTQNQVATLTGITQPIISHIETGKREPSLENLGILIDFYEVSADWILGTGKKIKK